MLNLNPGFYPTTAPPALTVKNQIIYLLQGISTTQDQQTMTLTDHGNDITLIGQIVQRLTTFVHHNATNLPAPPYPVPPAPSVIARPQVPVDPDAGNILLGCLMEGVQRWMDF